MRGHRAALIAILLVGIAAAAAAGDMTLTRHGDLYSVTPSDDGLVLTHRLADGTVASSLIPQTAGLVTSSVQVGVDELTGSVFVTWQVGEDLVGEEEVHGGSFQGQGDGVSLDALGVRGIARLGGEELRGAVHAQVALGPAPGAPRRGHLPGAAPRAARRTGECVF